MWEKIDENTDRLWIPSGWIVRSTKSMWSSDGVSISVHQVIVEDGEHKWVMGSGY